MTLNINQQNNFRITTTPFKYKAQRDVDDFNLKRKDDSEIRMRRSKLYTEQQLSDFYSYLNSHPQIKQAFDKEVKKDGKITFRKVQYSDGYKIHSQRAHILPNGTYIILKAAIDENANYKLSRTEAQTDSISTKYSKSANTTRFSYTKKYNPTTRTKSPIINEIIEIKENPNNGTPQKIIATTDVPFLNGAYEVKEFILSNYPEDIDIVKAIQAGEIEPSKQIAKANQLNDGTVVYEANFDSKETTIKISYSENSNNGLNSQYNLQICDKEGRELFCQTRSFETIGENKTKTTVNGKEYISTYTDSYIMIDTDNDKYFIIYNEPDSSISSDEFDDEENEKLSDFIKKIPIDLLLKSEELCCKIVFEDNIANGYADLNLNEIHSDYNLGILAHEIGHIIDYSQPKENISQNPQVIKTYQEEYRTFSEEQTDLAEEYFIKYFTPTGGAFKDCEDGFTQKQIIKNREKTGLAELVAEVNKLLIIPHSDSQFTKTRTHMLLRYFPKTIAKIAEILTSNSATQETSIFFKDPI